MKKIICILALMIIMCGGVFANTTEKVVTVISSSTDLGLGKYSRTKVLIVLKDKSGNEFTNSYDENQILSSNKDYSYVVDGSNCIYLSDVEYDNVHSEVNFTYWFWIIVLVGGIAIYLYYDLNKPYKSYNKW